MNTIFSVTPPGTGVPNVTACFVCRARPAAEEYVRQPWSWSDGAYSGCHSCLTRATAPWIASYCHRFDLLGLGRPGAPVGGTCRFSHAMQVRLAARSRDFRVLFGPVLAEQCP